MKKIPAEKVLLYTILIVSTVALTAVLHHVPRNRGRSVVGHLAFVVGTVLALVFMPDWLQDDIFSHGSVLVVSSFLPIYESLSSVSKLTAESGSTSTGMVKPQVSWLQYWIASATFSLATEFMDDEVSRFLPSSATKYWYHIEFIIHLWLLLPFTDGASIIFDYITQPFLLPTLTNWLKKLQGWGSVALVAVNAYHLWFIWFAFLSLPEEERRFLTVALGTVYPVLASTVVMSKSLSPQSFSGSNDTADTNVSSKFMSFFYKKKPATVSPLEIEEQVRFWLTYWTSYNLLFLAMDYLENFLGRIRGFYTLCALATLYLFLPMFNGCQNIYRNILVPLFGQQEQLMMYDVYQLRHRVDQTLPNDQKRREFVLNKAAQLMLGKSSDNMSPQDETMASVATGAKKKL